MPQLLLPATRLALRSNEWKDIRFLSFAVLLIAAQWIAVSLGFKDQARLLSLYVSEWILPCVVATYVTKERLSGRWQTAAVTRLTTFDLWFSCVIGPARPWLELSSILWFPFLLGQETHHLPLFPYWARRHQDTILNRAIDPAFYLSGILVSGLFYSAIAVYFGFRAKSPRAATVAVILFNGFLSYSGLALTFLRPVVGAWAEFTPAYGYAMSVGPEALLSPGWMLGAALYGWHSMNDYVLWLTVALYALMLPIACILSYEQVVRSRRPV